MIRHSRHVLAVRNLDRSTQYHRDILGFAVHEVGDPDWRFFVRDACFIMAGECPDALPSADLGDHSYFAYLEVDEIESLYETLVEKGVERVKRLRSEPWGMQEFGIRTIEGPRIMFGAPLQKTGGAKWRSS